MNACKQCRNLIARLLFICIETRYNTDNVSIHRILLCVLVHLVISKVYVCVCVCKDGKCILYVRYMCVFTCVCN